jgi:signal transduction histidine kinase
MTLGLDLMGTVVSGSRAVDPGLLTKLGEGRRGAHIPQHAAPSDGDPGADGTPDLFTRAVRTVRTYLPRGNTLDERTFQRRHLFLCWVLALHIPGLVIMGAWRGYAIPHLLLEMTVPAACVLFGRMARNRRLAAFFITAGLVYCSVVLVHLSGGAIEAHFHFFILIGLIALYQDWVPFLWNVMFTVLSHGLGTVVNANLIFGHEAAQNRPWTWALIHGVAVLAACVGVIIFWQHTEQEQQRNVRLVADLATADAQRREAMSELLVNLARRNQSLLNRQLEVITDLEVRERQPDVLEDLFRLDHLATRIRRNAESLLVLSGDDPARRWGKPVALADVVRAAAAEVEDYRRVEVLVNDHLEVTGRAVADLAHLLAELIENATTFSPPTSEVRVRSHLSPGETGAIVLSIEDAGIGMPEDELRRANGLLAEAPEVDLGRSTMLGFHVVARLAKRYGLGVRLAPTPGGGVTAMVTLPDELVSERPAGTVTTPAADVLNGSDRYHLAALARSNGHAGGAGARGASRRARTGMPDEPPPPPPPPGVERPRPSELVSPWREIPMPPPPATTAPSPAAPDGAADADPFASVVARWRQAEMDAARADLQAAPTADGTASPERPALLPAPIPELPPISPPDWWWQSESLVSRSGHGTMPGTAPGNGGSSEPPRAPAAPRTDVPTSRTPTVVPALDNGLVRRVPGAHLAPALRRDGAADQAPAVAAPPATSERNREHVRSMLASFQSGQRAGRAAADAEAARPPQEDQ